MCEKCDNDPDFKAVREFSAAMYALVKEDMLASEPGITLFVQVAEDHGPVVAATCLVAVAVRIRSPFDPGPGRVAEIHVQEAAACWSTVTANIPAPVLALVVPFINFSLAEDTQGVNSIWAQIARCEDYLGHVAAILTLFDLLYTGLNTTTRKARK